MTEKQKTEKKVWEKPQIKSLGKMPDVAGSNGSGLQSANARRVNGVS